MYTMNCWGIHLGIVAVDFLKQKPARTEVRSITAYVLRDGTQVSRMNTVYPKFSENSPE